MNTTTTNATTAVHPFQAAGLGLAPFKLVGHVLPDLTADGRRKLGEIGGVEVTTTTGGTCDYCGKSIVNVFRVRSADGRESNVGCDCVQKCCGAKLVAAVRKIANVVATDRRNAAADAKIARGVALLAVPAVAEALRDQPHPNGHAGRTLHDYAAWMLQNAGRTGKAAAAARIAAVATAAGLAG
jgi:hypothetical protein